MFSKIFTQLDAVAGVFILPSAAGCFLRTNIDGVNTDDPQAPSLVETGIGSWELTLNLASSAVAGVVYADCTWGGDFSFINQLCIEQTWSVTYDDLLGIPINAQIKKVTFRRPRSASVTFNATDFPGSGDNAHQLFLYGDALYTPIYFSLAYGSPFVGPVLVSESFAGVAADEILLDLTAGPTSITRAQLIASYSDFNNNLYGVSTYSGTDADGVNNQTASMNGTVQVGLGWQVEVEYELVFQWTLNQPQTSEGLNIPLEPGVLVTVSSDPNADDPLDFTQVTVVTLVLGDLTTINVPIGNWVDISANLFTFTIPSFGILTPTILTIQIESTQFTGPLPLQTLFTIYFLSATGIYELQLGKTSDTLYIEEYPGTTIDVKIPNPFGRTGFI